MTTLTRHIIINNRIAKKLTLESKLVDFIILVVLLFKDNLVSAPVAITKPIIWLLLIEQPDQTVFSKVTGTFLAFPI